MKVELFNYRLRLECNITKLATVDGINSNIDEAKKIHILLWDFDNAPLQEIFGSLWDIQHFFKLPSIYIVQSSLGHYHAYCFVKKILPDALYILSLTQHIDWTYFKLGVVRGYWTLRITPKKTGQQFRQVAFLDSKIPSDFESLDKLKLVQYKTGV